VHTHACLISHNFCVTHFQLSRYNEWATGWTTEDLRFDSRKGKHIFFFSITSGLVLGPTQPPLKWVSGVVAPLTKLPEREADHSPLSTPEIKNDGTIPQSPMYPFDKGLGGTQSRPGCCEEKNRTPAGNLTRVVQSVACRYAD
jgi:hypothetical protein